MDFPVTEMRDRRRLSLNVMLNCRTLLPDVKGEEEMINCFDYGTQNSRTCNRVACRRGTSSYRTSSDARDEDMCLRAMCFKAFLDGITLSNFKLLMEQKETFPPILMPELMSWAIHLDKSPKFLLAIFKSWPFEKFVLSEVFPLAFEGRTSWGLKQRGRFSINGFNTIAFGAVSKAYAWRYDCALSAVISAIKSLQEEKNLNDCKINEFDLTGVPISDADFSALAHLTKIPMLRSSKVQRIVLVDLSAEDIVANNVMEVLQCAKGAWRVHIVKCFWHCRLKKSNELQEILTTLNSEKTFGFSLSFSGLHNKLVRETLPGIIRLENLTSLDLSTNLLDFASPTNRVTPTVQDSSSGRICSELTSSLNYILKHLKKLSRLNLGGSRLTGQLGDMFFGISNKFRYLGLSGCFMNDKDLISISQNSCFDEMSELNICYNVLHGRQEQLGEVFRKLSSLRILEMECNHLRGDEIGQIFTHLSKTLNRLVCLNISCEFTRNVVWTYSNVTVDVLPQILQMSSIRYLKVPHIERQGFCRESDCELSDELASAVKTMQEQRLKNQLKPVLIDWKCSIW